MSGVIDTHVHLGGGKYASPAEWTAAADRHGVVASVLVQHLGHTDNAELLAAGADRSRHAVIGIPEPGQTEELLSAGAVGVRLSPLGLHANPGGEVFEVVADAHAIASVTGPFEQIADPAFAALVDARPDAHFRLEHVAAFPYAEHPLTAFAPVLRLAERANVSLMWSGFFHYSRTGYPYRDAWPVLEATLDAFGPERIHWSGDWNRAGGTDATYSADARLVDELPFVDAGAAEAIRSTTARRIFWEERA
jgi:predicted TIM-barrel fold metal-dependent hydrolase